MTVFGFENGIYRTRIGGTDSCFLILVRGLRIPTLLRLNGLLMD